SEGEQCLREALERSRRRLGEDHLLTVRVTRYLGQLLYRAGRLEEAERFLGEATERFRRTLGKTHPDTCSCVGALADLFREQGRLDAAEPLYAEALAGLRNQPGADQVMAAGIRAGLGGALAARGTYAEAEAALLEGERVLRPIQARGNRYTRCVRDLVALYEA